jgi:sugar O-acyltransferase (sialic acid O-acetyltransferase NeuD family)
VKRILLVGAGGHGQVVADIFLMMSRSDGKVAACGFLDDDPRLWGNSFIGLPVLGPVSLRSEIPHEGLIVAIGDNRTRCKVAESLVKAGEHLVSAIHPRAVLGTDVQVGAGSMICAGVIVNVSARVGQGVILNTGCTVDHHSNIGSFSHLAPGVHLGGEVTVDRGAFLGVGACVIPRCRIGAWAVVGGGATVIRDVPDEGKFVGVPAKPIKRASAETQ